MANPIKFKRGTKANLPVLNQGEPAYCTDTDEVFIGDGSTNHEILTKHATFDDYRVLAPETDHTVGGVGFEPGVTDESKCLHPTKILAVGARCDTAGTGSSTIIDVKNNSVSILSTLITIDDGETSSETAATQPVISAGDIALDDVITYHITQVGSTTPGKGLSVWMKMEI